jgi:Putative adhesin
MAVITAPFPMTRARRAALVIGVPVCLLLVGYNGLDLVANFGEGHYPVNHTFPAGAKSLNLNVTGQLTIKPTAASQATLTGTARYSLVRTALTEHASGGAITLGYGCDVPVGDCGLDATVTVPATVTTLTTNSGGGNATVTGTTGPVTLSTGDGDLSVTHASGPLTLNTASGSIAVSAIRSKTLSASSGDGSIQVTGVTSATAITANTDSGSIDWSGIATTTLTASTGNGNIDIAFTSVPSDVRVNTNSGTITLLLPPGKTKYHVTANTDSGTVTDTLPQQQTSSGHVITASSGSGDITIIQQ